MTPKAARKVSALSRNRPQHPVNCLTPGCILIRCEAPSQSNQVDHTLAEIDHNNGNTMNYSGTQLYGHPSQFSLSRRKDHIFSPIFTRLMRTPINTDNGHFSVSQVTNSRISSTPLYGHWLSAHCLFSL